MFNLKKKWLGFMMLSIPSNLFNLTIYYIINFWITNKTLEWYAFFSYTILLIFSYFTTLFFQEKIIDYTLKNLFENELKIIKVLRDSSYEKIEKKGISRFVNIIDDIRYFLIFPGILSSTIYSIVTIIFGILYMFFLSKIGGSIFLFVIIIVTLLYAFLTKKAVKRNSKLKELDDKYYNFLSDIINGLKSLKINSTKNHTIFDEGIIKNRISYLEQQKSVLYFNLNSSLLSKYSLFFVLSIFLFILPKLEVISMDIVLSYVIIILFLTESINSLIAMQNFYSKAFSSSKRIENFFNKNITNLENKVIHNVNQNKELLDFKEINFSQINFNYYTNDKDVFFLKNINFKIKKGEVVFFTGGNGSGKSTLIKIILGLYHPKSGKIEIDGVSTDASKEEYKSLFSAIFTDNYNFSENYFGINDDNELMEIIKKMNLKNYLKGSNDLFKDNFSKGQNKRISLIISLLEKRPILILDEWAAEQDPIFRKYFYEKIIPTLKEEGKTIIAVTHDDSYFKYADRIIKFDYGEIVQNIEI